MKEASCASRQSCCASKLAMEDLCGRKRHSRPSCLPTSVCRKGVGKGGGKGVNQGSGKGVDQGSGKGVECFPQSQFVGVLRPGVLRPVC
eukprot:1118418-Prymnesium_polylepis.2